MAQPADSGKWSIAEVRLIVADYFDMLRDELMQRRYSKTAHRQALLSRLPGRSASSVEWKHRNISSVLCDLGHPYIEGYKPAEHRQSLLADAIEAYLSQHPTFLADLVASPRIATDLEPALHDSDLDRLVTPPPDMVLGRANIKKPWIDRSPGRIDFVARDAADRQLGRAGEELVVQFEQYRLKRIARDDLAAKVELVAETIGDGLGFDILSFNESDDTERLIEVKTTGLGKFFPFYLTANEVNCSQDVAEQFHLYRVYNFSTKARLFILSGSVTDSCDLIPATYRGTARGTQNLASHSAD